MANKREKAQPDERAALTFDEWACTYADRIPVVDRRAAWDAVVLSTAPQATPERKRDDTGRLTSNYEPTPHEIEVARQAICREFGNNGTDGYYVRILKAIHGAAPQAMVKGDEPVAWQQRCHGGSWEECSAESARRVEGCEGFEVRALYARAAVPQASTLTDEQIAVLSRLRDVLASGHAYNGIGNDNAVIYADALRALLAAAQGGNT